MQKQEPAPNDTRRASNVETARSSLEISKAAMKDPKATITTEEDVTDALPLTSTYGLPSYDGDHEVASSVKGKRGARLIKHVIKYWPWYVTLKIVIFLAILLPLTFLVFFPLIGQALLNKQELILHNASLLQPAVDEMTFVMSSSISVPKPFTVDLDPFNMSLFMCDGDKAINPYAYLQLPQQKLHGNATINIGPERAKIINSDQWFAFLNASLYSESLTLAAKGTTTAHFGALKAKLTLDKDIKINGLNKLKGFGVRDSTLLPTPDELGHNLKATLDLPNWSPVTFDLGDQSFNLRMHNVVIGNATVYNLTLTPGNNARTLYGTIDLKTVLGQLGSVPSSGPGAGLLQITTTGLSTVYNGLHVPYYETLLAGLELQVSMPIAELIG